MGKGLEAGDNRDRGIDRRKFLTQAGAALAGLAAIPTVLDDAEARKAPDKRKQLSDLASASGFDFGEKSLGRERRIIGEPFVSIPRRIHFELVMRTNAAEREQVNGDRRPRFEIVQELFAAEQRLPKFIRDIGPYIPMQESSYRLQEKPNRVGARGPWQFMPGDGQTYGLYPGGIDHRADFVPATNAAIKYLTDRTEEFKSDPLFASLAERYKLSDDLLGYLVVNSYNTGKGNMHAALKLMEATTLKLYEKAGERTIRENPEGVVTLGEGEKYHLVTKAGFRNEVDALHKQHGEYGLMEFLQKRMPKLGPMQRALREDNRVRRAIPIQEDLNELSRARKRHQEEGSGTEALIAELERREGVHKARLTVALRPILQGQYYGPESASYVPYIWAFKAMGDRKKSAPLIPDFADGIEQDQTRLETEVASIMKKSLSEEIQTSADEDIRAMLDSPEGSFTKQLATSIALMLQEAAKDPNAAEFARLGNMTKSIFRHALLAPANPSAEDVAKVETILDYCESIWDLYSEDPKYAKAFTSESFKQRWNNMYAYLYLRSIDIVSNSLTKPSVGGPERTALLALKKELESGEYFRSFGSETNEIETAHTAPEKTEPRSNAERVDILEQQYRKIAASKEKKDDRYPYLQYVADAALLEYRKTKEPGWRALAAAYFKQADALLEKNRKHPRYRVRKAYIAKKMRTLPK